MAQNGLGHRPRRHSRPAHRRDRGRCLAFGHAVWPTLPDTSNTRANRRSRSGASVPWLWCSHRSTSPAVRRGAWGWTCLRVQVLLARADRHRPEPGGAPSSPCRRGEAALGGVVPSHQRWDYGGSNARAREWSRAGRCLCVDGAPSWSTRITGPPARRAGTWPNGRSATADQVGG